MDIAAIKPGIEALARKYGLSLVVLFGSQATGRIHQKSDVDIAILSSSTLNRARLALELDQIFKRDDIEVTDMAHASPTLMRAIVADGKLLYEGEQDLFFRWKLYAIKIWMETGWLRRLADKRAVEIAKRL